MSKPLLFDNFDLHIGQQKDGVYPVSVQASPAGETSEPVNIEITHHDESLCGLLRRLPTGSIKQEELRVLGQSLANWLLPPGRVRDLYHHSRGQAFAQERGLRLRLRITPPELASLPWEYTYDDQRNDFLALHAQTVLVRYHHQPVAPLPITSHKPVPILLLISNPPGTAPLQTVQECKNIMTALSKLLNKQQVTLDVLFSGVPGGREAIKTLVANQAGVYLLPGEASVDGLRDALRKEKYRVLHYIGHGVIQPQIGAALLLTNKKGRIQEVRARTLARELQGSSAAVVVLNACQSGAMSTALSFMGLAPTLIRVGVPAVIAMQYPISDKSSIAFSRVLYQALADGLPLDAAVTEGRKVISAQNTRYHAQWGVPVLFMRSPNGVIWQTETEPPSSSTTPPRDYSRNEKLSDLKRRFEERNTRDQRPTQIGTRDQPPRRLLLYLPDRNEHEYEIKDSLQEFKHNRNRHLVYIMHGDEDQSHDMFLERMQSVILPQSLTFASQEIVVKNYLIRWLNSYRDTKQLERWLLQQLSEEVDPAHRENRSHINRAFALHPGPVMIQSHVMTSDWFNTSPLEAFLHFWNSWPSQPSAYPLVLCLSITYQDTSQMGWRQFRQRRKYKQHNSRIKEELERLDKAAYRNLHLTILPPLNDVARGDVENWARLNRTEVQRWRPLDKLLNDIRDLFKGREGIPMNALANHLERILLRKATQA